MGKLCRQRAFFFILDYITDAIIYDKMGKLIINVFLTSFPWYVHN